MDIALLARVSSQRQEKEETVETQLDYGRNWAALNGYRIPEGCLYIDEGVSGLTPLAERPEGQRLLADARAGKFQAVAFYRLDRLGRNILVVYTAIDQLETLGVGVISMTENFNSHDQFGRLMIGFLALMAQWERESLLMRTRDGKDRVAREGKWTGGRQRYGYRLEDGRLLIDPATAAVVMEIFRLYATEGLALQKVADTLIAKGIPNPSHTRGERVKTSRKTGREMHLTANWYPGTLRKILTDPLYKGAAEWGGVPQFVEPIVPPDIWAKAQARLKTNKQWKSKQWDGRHNYLLRGLVYCACGRTAQGTTWTNGRRLSGGRHCYKCRDGLTTSKRRAPGVERCRMPFLPCEVEQEILAECRRFLEQPGLLVRMLTEQQGGAAAQQERVREALYAAQGQRAGLAEERERLRRQLRKGTVTEEEWESDCREMEEERQELDQQIERLTEHLGHLDQEQGYLEDAERLLQQMREGALSDREIVVGLVKRVTIVCGEDGKVDALVDYYPSDPAAVREGAVDPSPRRPIHDTLVLRRAYGALDRLAR